MFLVKSFFSKSFVICCLCASFTGCKQDEIYFQEKSPLKSSKQSSLRYNSENVFHKISEQYKDRVLFISTEKRVTERPFFPFLAPFFENERPRTRKETGLGSGFFVSEDGYICTNHHVVADMDRVNVKLNGVNYTAEIIGSDELLDVALLKIDPRSGDKFKPVYFGDSEAVKVGDWSIAIGNPFGLERTFTLGVISAAARENIDLLGNAHIQTDASINPGNSGGPLINMDGEVIGVNRMIYSKSGGSAGIGFAIPINLVRKALGDLKKYKKVIRGYIGVQGSDLSGDIAVKLGLSSTEGALVINVYTDGPASKAGLKRGDVIRKFNDTEIKTFNDLLRETTRTQVGSIVKIEFLRNNQKHKIKFKVAERP